MAEFTTPDLHWGDYVVFAVYLALVTTVGIVIGVINRKKASSSEFIKAGSDMHFFPVAMSIQASFLSAIFIVSTPAESYNFGIGYAYLILSYFIAYPLIGRFVLPVFFRLKITSAYEYLQMRFNKIVRTAVALTFLVEMILYISVVIYTPALTFETVTPLPTYACILLVSGVCILYTIVGGMRATIWNDLIQMIVIVACLAMLIGFGHANAGSIREVYEIARNGSRLEFNIFKPDPTERTTFWTQVLGGTFLDLAMYAASQTIIQKALSTKSLEDAQRSLLVVSFLSAITLAMVMWVGIVMYAFYSQCDPQLYQGVQADQLVPLFMVEVMGEFHGLPGLFLAATFSGALSTVSGGINSMAAVVLVDFIDPIYHHYKSDHLPERLKALWTRILVLIIGVVVTVMAFVTPYMGDLILSIALSIFGMVGGPICGVVLTGIFIPCVNSWGALTGLLASLGLTMWLGIGTLVAGPELPYLPHSTEGCPVDNATFATTPSLVTLTEDWFSTTAGSSNSGDDVFGFYKVSYMYYGLFAIGTAMIVSVLVSLVTGLKKDVPYEYVYSCADTCCQCCPKSARDKCRCGALPPDDDLEAVEVLQVHFKKRAGSSVAGLDHPIRQLSYVFSPESSEVSMFAGGGEDKRDVEHSLHTALYNRRSLQDLQQLGVYADMHDAGKVYLPPPTHVIRENRRLSRHDSGIMVGTDWEKLSERSSSDQDSDVGARSGHLTTQEDATCAERDNPGSGSNNEQEKPEQENHEHQEPPGSSHRDQQEDSGPGHIQVSHDDAEQGAPDLHCVQLEKNDHGHIQQDQQDSESVHSHSEDHSHEATPLEDTGSYHQPQDTESTNLEQELQTQELINSSQDRSSQQSSDSEGSSTFLKADEHHERNELPNEHHELADDRNESASEHHEGHESEDERNESPNEHHKSADDRHESASEHHERHESADESPDKNQGSADKSPDEHHGSADEHHESPDKHHKRHEWLDGHQERHESPEECQESPDECNESSEEHHESADEYHEHHESQEERQESPEERQESPDECHESPEERQESPDDRHESSDESEVTSKHQIGEDDFEVIQGAVEIGKLTQGELETGDDRNQDRESLDRGSLDPESVGNLDHDRTSLIQADSLSSGSGESSGYDNHAFQNVAYL